jgi:ATP-binding cassette subfamily F protein 3
LLFSGDDIHKKIAVLSGGEKSRVALGQILLKRSPLLLLDEPTNHLDFDTVEAMTEALRDYTGTLIVVSHDRSFIGRIANRILEIRGGRLEVYPGTYDEYVWSLQKGVLSELAAPEESATKTIRTMEAPKGGFKEDGKRLQSRIKELQRKTQQCEKQITGLSGRRDELTSQLLSAQGTAAQSLAKELGLCSQEIERLEGEMLRHMEDQDGAERALQELRAR